MKSNTTEKFRECYRTLPPDIQKKAKVVYTIFQSDPWYPSLHFKRVHSSLPIYSVRITKNYRAVGTLKNEKIIWFWIGSHSAYNKLLKQVKNV